MASRSASLPPGCAGGGAVNPFWSERLKAEAGLRRMRPADLPPVPGGEDDFDLARESEGEKIPMEDRTSSRVRKTEERGRSHEPAPGRFSTPASWSGAQDHGGLRTEGEMPSGPMEMDSEMADGLQRELEKEVVQQLHVENQRLRMELEKLQAGKRSQETPSSWSAVTPETVPVPPRSRSPVRMQLGEKSALRFTPGGTQVPEGRPPDDLPAPPVLPEWPAFLRDYEVCSSVGPCAGRMGPSTVGLPNGSRRSFLPDRVCRGGADPRQLYDEVCGGGVYPRRLHDQEYGSGARSRYEEGLVQERVEKEMASMSLKAKWLEEELASFKRALELEPQARASRQWDDNYWRVPVHRHGGVSHQECHGDRAHSSHQECHGDRAHSSHQECHGDRAHNMHRECHGDRAQSFHQECQGDRAQSISQECQRDRAQSTHNECPGDRANGIRSEGQGGVAMLDGRQGAQDGQELLQRRDLLPNGAGMMQSHTGNYGGGDQTGSGPKVELPALPAATTPMDLGDWLILVGPIMRDLSQHATMWWKRTVEEAHRYYEVWRTASPLKRVQLQVQLPQDLALEPYVRTEQRGVGLLLRAVPEELKKVLISNRDITSTAIIWRLLTTYQPGGAGEKSYILRSLTSLQVGDTAMELATGLRQWRRCFQRAQEIGATLPDGTLMVHGLEPGAALLGRLDAQSAFRVASARSELKIDERPDHDNMWAYSQVLLAEAETLQLVGAQPSPLTPATPKVKQLGLAASPLKTSQQEGVAGVCRFWGTEAGCKYGRQCRFQHQQLPDQNKRCYLCGSVQHHKAQCPTKGASLPSSAGGSEIDKDKDKGKGGDKGSGKGSGKKPAGKDGNSGKKSGDDGPSTKPAVNKTIVEEEEKNTSSTASNGSGQSPGPGSNKGGATAAATGETLMDEVAGLLRSLRLQHDPQPALRGCQVRRLGAKDQVRCLLDGGATHCMRQCENEQEWAKAVEVSVSLAQGDAVMRQDPSTTTLLTKERVQPIVPLAKVAALGFRVVWDSAQCKISHNLHGSLDVLMEQGCPTVDLKTGKWLMAEIEKQQHSLKSLSAVLNGAAGDGTPEQNRWQVLRRLFPEVPLRVLQRIPGKRQWQGENLPFNRHQRRRIEKAKYVVVHAFCGKDDGFWKKLETNDVAVLALDVCHGADLADPDLGGYLEDLAVQGKIDLWISGPPCRSTSVARHRSDQGPVPLRGRYHEERFGLPDLSPSQLEQVDLDSVLWLRNLWWIWLAYHHRDPDRRPMETLVEQPQDPCEWKDQSEPYPTFTKWPETLSVMRATGMTTTRLSQGALGHSTVKPTALMNSIKEVQQLDGLEAKFDESTRWPDQVQDRLQFSKSLASWAPGLKLLLKEVIQSRALVVTAKVRKFSKAEKDSVAAWQAHFDFGHVPFRHDCSICLESAGRDRPRRQLEHKTSYCLSIDVAGPFQPGIDQAQGPDPRYFLVANLSIPVNSAGPMVAGLQDLGFRPQPPQENLDGTPANLDEEPQPSSEVPTEEQQDPMALQEHETEDVEAAMDVEVVDRSVQEQKWKEFIHGAPEVESKVLTFAVPLVSRKTPQVLSAVASIYARARSMQVPILRVHTDRAQEFGGSAFRKWCLDRSLWHTMSPGDEPTQNSRVERTIGLLKNKVRTAIKASKAPMTWWPLALRYSAETMLRDQLWTMGIFTPRIPVFGAVGIAKSKTWHQRTTPWKFPGCRVRIWGPAGDMSITSGGVYIQDEQGRWMRSTVVRPVSDPLVDDDGRVITAVPNNQAGGSHLVTPVDPDKAEKSEEITKDTLLASSVLAEEETPMIEVAVVDNNHGIVEGGIKPVPLRHRLHGKQTVDAVPALYACRAGGEEELVQHVELQWLEGLKLVQHKMLKQLVNEEVVKLQEGTGSGCEGEVLMAMQATLQGLEKELHQLQQVQQGRCEEQEKKIRALQVAETGEVLQTQTVSLEEVRKDLQAWVEPFKTEVETILKSGAMEVIDDHKYQQLLKEHPDLERLPMLAVATIKPPYKRKGRVVVCGNHSSKQPQQGEPDPSVGGVDTVAIRCILALAVQRQLQVGSIDVKGAFLQAPRRSVALRPTVCDPPAILKQMQLVEKSEKWLVHKALYGFVESPSDWSFHRDTTMRQLRWTSNGCSMRFQQTAEKHVWRVVQEGQEGSDHGYVAVYVDDLLFAVTKEHLTGVVTALKGAWQCSEPEFVAEDRAMRFCGFELQWVQGGGLRLSQEGFITEMLKRRDVQGESKFPLQPISDEPDENPINIEDVRQAQGVVGELTWLTTRSRPDLAFSVGAASRLIHRRPRYVLEMCGQILKYVNTTKSLALTYRRCEPGDMGDQQELQVSKSMDSLQIFSDASYGPVHERCKSISGAVTSYAGCVVAWDSQAQPFVSQSTAEAEVISYNSASQMAESVSAFLEAVGYVTTKQLYGDSKAGIAVISNECGPWRTRHLRIRASKLRELVQTPQGCWTIRHMPGSLLVADGCTKPLTHQAFEMFQQRLGLEARVKKQEPEMKRCFLQSEGVKNLDKAYGVLLAVACGLLFWGGQVRAGSGLLAALTGLQLWKQ